MKKEKEQAILKVIEHNDKAKICIKNLNKDFNFYEHTVNKNEVDDAISFAINIRYPDKEIYYEDEMNVSTAEHDEYKLIISEVELTEDNWTGLENDDKIILKEMLDYSKCKLQKYFEMYDEIDDEIDG